MSKKIKELLKEGKPVVGCFVGLYCPSIVEMLGNSGFDFIVIDNEHGPFSWLEVEEMIRACEISGLIPIVRVASSTPSEILKALDRGAKGVHVPQVNSGAEARAVVDAARFPPEGKRGVAYMARGAKFGLHGGPEYLAQCNEDILVCVQIETPQAVRDVDAIMQSGVDLVFIGPLDLSVSSGHAGQPNHPEMEEMKHKVLEAGKKAGIPIGIFALDQAGLERSKAWGAQYIGMSLELILFETFSKVLKS